MDDTPRQFVHELRSTLLKKFVGRIAVAIVLAEACLRVLNALTWFLVIPVIAAVLKGNTESVLFKNQQVFPWEQLFGSILEFAGTLIFLFYVNRWINKPVAQSPTIPCDAPAKDVPAVQAAAATASSHVVS
jgi:large-conductance mechanosensitive channel